MSNKSPDAFRTISEVADWLGVPTHVLRFWESRFAQVKPIKRAGGRRYYRRSDMALLGGIRKLLHEDGMTIRGVQKLLREEGVKHVSDMAPPLDEDDLRDVSPANVVQLDQARAQEPTPEPEPEPEIEEAEIVAPEPVHEPEPEPELNLQPEPVAESMAELTPEPEPEPAADIAAGPANTPGDEQSEEPLAASAPAQEAGEGETSAQPQELAPDLPEIEATPEGLEFLAHDAEPIHGTWDTPSPTAGEAPMETSAPEQAPPAPAPESEAAPESEPEPEPKEAAQSPQPAQAPPSPPFGDISHIPEDPPEPDPDTLAGGEGGLLATLANARKSGIGPQNKVGLTVIIERLTALRARMDSADPTDPSA